MLKRRQCLFQPLYFLTGHVRHVGIFQQLAGLGQLAAHVVQLHHLLGDRCQFRQFF